VAFENEAYAYDGREWRCAAKTELTPWAGALAGFLIKRMEAKLRQAARFHYPLAAEAARMLGENRLPRARLRALLCSEEFARSVDAAVEAFTQSRFRGQEAGGRGRDLPPVTVDYAKLPEIRREAMELTERLIVEDNEQFTMNNEPLTMEETPDGDDSLRISHCSLKEALSPAQAAILDSLAAGENAPMSELELEAINAVALEVLGDTLLYTEEEQARVYEEYARGWKEGRL
jgi:hypothetical protein